MKKIFLIISLLALSGCNDETTEDRVADGISNVIVAGLELIDTPLTLLGTNNPNIDSFKSREATNIEDEDSPIFDFETVFNEYLTTPEWDLDKDNLIISGKLNNPELFSLWAEMFEEGEKLLEYKENTESITFKISRDKYELHSEMIIDLYANNGSEIYTLEIKNGLNQFLRIYAKDVYEYEKKEL